MTDTEERWRALAARVNTRMRERSIRRQIDLVRMTGLSDATIRPFMTGNLRNGVEPEKSSREMVSLALGWTDDSVDRILSGREPLDIRAAIDSAQFSADVANRKWRKLVHDENREPFGDPEVDAATDAERAARQRLDALGHQLNHSQQMLSAAHSVAPAGDFNLLRGDLDRLRFEVEELRRSVTALQMAREMDDAERMPPTRAAESEGEAHQSAQ